MSIPARYKHIAISLLFVFATINFIKTTLNVLQSSTRLSELKEEVASLEEQEAVLEEKISYKQTVGFIEKEAREKLSMIMPGEEVFVFSGENKLRSVLSASSEKVSRSNEPNFKLWLRLFL